MGPVLSGGMGPAPITFSEIESWQRQTGVSLQPWELRLMRRLSFDYITETQKAAAPECPPPWAPDDDSEKNRAATANKVKNVMRSFILSKEKP
ncbi:MAG: hypothetical protein PHV02_08625 [Rhodocyclaceae bacterium]|nr:hypothetical protein [Rhodocyclaceae bacterium]